MQGLLSLVPRTPQPRDLSSFLVPHPRLSPPRWLRVRRSARYGDRGDRCLRARRNHPSTLAAAVHSRRHSQGVRCSARSRRRSCSICHFHTRRCRRSRSHGVGRGFCYIVPRCGPRGRRSWRTARADHSSEFIAELAGILVASLLLFTAGRRLCVQLDSVACAGQQVFPCSRGFLRVGQQWQPIPFICSQSQHHCHLRACHSYHTGSHRSNRVVASQACPCPTGFSGTRTSHCCVSLLT